MRPPCCQSLLVLLLCRGAIVEFKPRCCVSLCSGNRRTGEVAWEQDIRPSDATYLAEQWKVPFYIDSGVWHETAITHSELQESERDYELPFDRPADKESARNGTLQAPDPDSPREPVVLTHSVDSPVDAAGIRYALLCPALARSIVARCTHRWVSFSCLLYACSSYLHVQQPKLISDGCFLVDCFRCYLSPETL